MTEPHSIGPKYRQFNLMECAGFRILYPPMTSNPDEHQALVRTCRQSKKN